MLKAFDAQYVMFCFRNFILELNVINYEKNNHP